MTIYYAVGPIPCGKRHDSEHQTLFQFLGESWSETFCLLPLHQLTYLHEFKGVIRVPSVGVYLIVEHVAHVDETRGEREREREREYRGRKSKRGKGNGRARERGRRRKGGMEGGRGWEEMRGNGEIEHNTFERGRVDKCLSFCGWPTYGQKHHTTVASKFNLLWIQYELDIKICCQATLHCPLGELNFDLCTLTVRYYSWHPRWHTLTP